jgi:hypothetical protein
MAKNVLTHNLSLPLNGTKAATVEISADSGNLTVDRLTSGDDLLANGTLQYFEQQGQPTETLRSSNGQATLTLKGGGTARSWFRLPWEACIGAYQWEIHLNPTVAAEISAHSGGGNVKLDLGGMAITRLSAGTGGGNMDVVLPDNAADLNVTARTGAGNVTVEVGSGITGRSTVDATSGAGNVVVRVPRGIAAKLHSTSGLGKVIVDEGFTKIDASTYQSRGYDGAVNTIEITATSGAGNVSLTTR